MGYARLRVPSGLLPRSFWQRTASVIAPSFTMACISFHAVAVPLFTSWKSLSTSHSDSSPPNVSEKNAAFGRSDRL